MGLLGNVHQILEAELLPLLRPLPRYQLRHLRYRPHLLYSQRLGLHLNRRVAQQMLARAAAPQATRPRAVSQAVAALSHINHLHPKPRTALLDLSSQ